MSDQVSKKDLVLSNQKKVMELLDKIKPQLSLCLPKHLSADRVCRIALTEFRKSPMLMECDPMSFIASVMIASQLGLEIGILGSAYIVPFRNTKKGIVECNFIPGYRGLIDLARRSGNIISISAEIVYENDMFEFEKGLNERLIHKPVLTDRGTMIAAYAVAKLKDGGAQFVVMSKKEIDDVKNKSRSQTGPWITDYFAMAQKTVVRRLFKWLPSSVEMQKAAMLDEHHEEGIQDIQKAFTEEIDVPSLELSNDNVDIETGEVKSQVLSVADKLS